MAKEQGFSERPLTLYILVGAVLIYLFLSARKSAGKGSVSAVETNLQTGASSPVNFEDQATVTVPPPPGFSPQAIQSANDAWQAALAAGKVGYGTQADRDRLRMLGPNGLP